MQPNLIDEYYLDTEIKYLNLNEQVADHIIYEYKQKGPYRKCDYNSLNSLLYNYFYLKRKNKHKLLEEILNKYNINYNSSIHNAIYDLLIDNENRAMLWPGVISIENNGFLYQLKTIIGNINVYKASEIFANDKSSYIFKRPLRGNCFARSLDFIKENRDYKVVFSYDDDIFIGGHFHAYLEKNGITLDIASNALYKSKEEKDKVFKGEIISKLTYDEAIDSFNKVLEEVPNLDSNDDKLQVLALYFGKKKGIK